MVAIERRFEVRKVVSFILCGKFWKRSLEFYWTFWMLDGNVDEMMK